MKKILLVNGSPRSDGSSKGILNAISEKMPGGFARETADLGTLKISPCTGCLGCKRTGRCIVDDDMTALYAKIQDADVIAFAFPIYFGAENGLFKDFIDRLYALLDGKAGVYKPRFGVPKKVIMVANCGASDGDAKYGNVTERLVGIMKMFGVKEVLSKTVPNTHAGIKDSQALKELMTEAEELFSS